METEKVFSLFKEMIAVAREELVNFTTQNKLIIDAKIDRSLVTDCDKTIDMRLTQIAKANGFQVISEEGVHSQQIVETGNYLTIDPIDGTLGYLDYCQAYTKENSKDVFLSKDLGAGSDFCLLLGIVENSKPRFAACFNYITHELVLIDAQDKNKFIRINNIRAYQGANVVYVDQREGNILEKELTLLKDVKVIKQAALGLKSLYTIINPHKNSITYHSVQTAGLWDVMPAAVASRAFEGELFDGKGELLEFDKYIILPGLGATIIKGPKFKAFRQKLQN